MKVALLNVFPNLQYSAEREFIKRCIIVLERLGHEATEVATSDEIIVYNPDFVVVTHDYAAKTTPHYTVGLLWSPIQFYENEPDRIKAIRSWDLVVPINAATRQFARDAHFPLRHDSAVSDLDFYPSAQLTEMPFSDSGNMSLAYVGAHWDGNRHESLFRALSELVDLHVYGPPKAWGFLPGCYRGSLPFDGETLTKTMNRHGAVLAIHKSSHVDEDTPSMRVFEAIAAKCLVITDPMPSLSKIFGDSIHYVDAARSPAFVAREIAGILTRHKQSPELHRTMANRAYEAFASKASLEKLIPDLLDDVSRRMSANAARSDAGAADVTVIVRCGSRPLSMVKRAVDSLARQTYRRIGVVFARYAEIEGFGPWLEELRRVGRFLFLTDLPAPGGVRSRTMWTGLRAVQTELFCMLDDDDELFPNHICDLVGVLRHDSEASVAYCGVVVQEEDGAFLNAHSRFKGDIAREVKERRALRFFDDFDLDRLLRFDNYICVHAWVARRSVLTPDVLVDPALDVAEDMYFYLLLASRCRFVFSDTVSAVWNWRSAARDNSMRSVPNSYWHEHATRLRRRLARITFPPGYPGSRVLGSGLPVNSSQQQGTGSPASAEGAAFGAGGDRLSRGEIERRAIFGRLRDAATFQVRSLQRLLRSMFAKRGLTDPGEPFVDERCVSYLVDFSAERLPSFIVGAFGVSFRERWGRWTDGSCVRIVFRGVLPSVFTLRIHGRAFESVHQRPIMVKVGETQSSFVMDATKDSTCFVRIENTQGDNAIEFHIPDAKAPATLYPGISPDARELGVALIRIDLIEADSDVKIERPHNFVERGAAHSAN